MANVLLSNDDLTVLGSPETVELLVDFGPQGTRGTQFFVGIGDPNVINIGQTPLLNDLYINIAPGVDYSYLYQYISQPGGYTWVKVLKTNPVLYSKAHLVSFSSGDGQIQIPLSNIVSSGGASLTADNFNVQYSILGSNPIAAAVSIPAISSNTLTINLKGVEYDGSSWSNLSGNKTVQLFISIML